jgi:hypothetical protein
MVHEGDSNHRVFLVIVIDPRYACHCLQQGVHRIQLGVEILLVPVVQEDLRHRSLVCLIRLKRHSLLLLECGFVCVASRKRQRLSFSNDNDNSARNSCIGLVRSTRTNILPLDTGWKLEVIRRAGGRLRAFSRRLRRLGVRIVELIVRRRGVTIFTVILLLPRLHLGRGVLHLLRVSPVGASEGFQQRGG